MLKNEPEEEWRYRSELKIAKNILVVEFFFFYQFFQICYLLYLLFINTSFPYTRSVLYIKYKMAKLEDGHDDNRRYTLFSQRAFIQRTSISRNNLPQLLNDASLQLVYPAKATLRLLASSTMSLLVFPSLLFPCAEMSFPCITGAQIFEYAGIKCTVLCTQLARQYTLLHA